MSYLDRERFKHAARYGYDLEMQQAAENLWRHSHDKVDAAKFIAETLEEERPNETRTSVFGDEVVCDGIRVVKSSFRPQLEINGVDP